MDKINIQRQRKKHTSTIGCAGCGDTLFIKGKYFGEKTISNPNDTSSKLAFK